MPTVASFLPRSLLFFSRPRPNPASSPPSLLSRPKLPPLSLGFGISKPRLEVLVASSAAPFDEVDATGKSNPSSSKKSILSNLIQEIEPLDLNLIQKDVPVDTVDAMKRTISSMLGLLPSEQFHVSVEAFWDPLFKLLVNSMMTGYTLRNAEYRLGLERNLDICEDHSEKQKLDTEQGSHEIIVDGTPTMSEVCERNGLLPDAGNSEEESIFEYIGVENLGEITPEAQKYILYLKSRLSSAQKELDVLRRKNSALQMQQFVGEEKNDLLDYLRSLQPEKVAELSEPACPSVQETIECVVHGLLATLSPSMLSKAPPLSENASGGTLNRGMDDCAELVENTSLQFQPMISLSRDYLARLLFWKTVKSGAQTQRKDPAWKHGVQVEGERGYVYIKCNYCSKVIKGGVKRMKDHIGGTHKNVQPCTKAPDEAKTECLQYMKKYTSARQAAQEIFEEMAESGSYFGAPICGNQTSGRDSCSGPSGSVHTRGIRGPMDRFMNNVGAEGGEVTEIPSEKAPTTTKEHRNRVCMDIGRFFFENALSFNVATTPSFFNMIRSVGEYGRGLNPPTMHELRTWILDEEVKTTTLIVDDIKKTWQHTGVSILSDGWSDIRNRSLINFLVNNPHGTVFLKSIDASSYIKDSEKLFELLDGIVEEVGEHLVVQVVTDNASAYKAAGRKLMEKRQHLYWTPCAAHCIDLMLESIGKLPQHKNALTKGKRVTNFIYNHQWVLSLMRKIAKKEIIRPGITRFATAFLTLHSIYRMKQSLEQVFTSTEWSESKWAKTNEGKEVRKIILKDRTFWSSVVYVMKTTSPLVSVLRMVDGEKEPAMGFIYGAMDKAKEQIAKNLGGELSAYKEIWDIIDERWDNQLHRDLHGAGYFLNPRFHYSDSFDECAEVKRGLYNCLERLIIDQDDQRKADFQIDAFRHKQGLFGRNLARTSYEHRSPGDWGRGNLWFIALNLN